MAIIFPMEVRDLGEFGLIEILSRIAPQGDPGHHILVNIGDDAAAWRGENLAVLATTDALVEGVHFTAVTSWRDRGWKAMAAGLSDIAAMGGEPRYALVALTLPEQTQVEDVSQLYQGMADLAIRFSVAVVGGNVSRAPLTTITLTVIGRVEEDKILTRSAARHGDLLALTGHLGSSAAGLRLLTRGLDPGPEYGAFLRSAHLQPLPQIACGRHLSACGVRCAIDISDGLLADLGHLCKASSVGAVVWADRLPVHPATKAVFPEDCLDLALGGGEDYELLFTAGKDIIEKSMNSIESSTSCPITVIGEITGQKEGIRVLTKDGQPYVTAHLGWDHFSKGG